MLDLDDLVAAAEQHAVLADDRAAADSGNADLVRRTLFAALVAVVDIFSLVGQGGGNCVCEHDRRAGRRVELLIVVLLDDLNVVLVAENGSRLLEQLAHQVDADGHVARTEYRNGGGGCADAVKLLGAVAGGADHDRQTARLTVIEQTLGQRGVRKVDDNIAVTLILRKILVDREICVLFGANIKADSDFHAVAAADDIADHTAHAAAAAGKRDF